MSVIPYLIVGYPIINLKAEDYNELEQMLDARFQSDWMPTGSYPCIVHMQSSYDTIDLDDHHLFVAWKILKLDKTVDPTQLIEMTDIKPKAVPDDLKKYVIELGEIGEFGIHTALSDFDIAITYYYTASDQGKVILGSTNPSSMTGVPVIAQLPAHIVKNGPYLPSIVLPGDMLQPAFAQKATLGEYKGNKITLL